jgi:hypothetical protein
VTYLLIKYAKKVVSSASEAGTLPFGHTAEVQKFKEFLDFAAGRYSIRKIRNSKAKPETGGRNCAAGHPLHSFAMSPGIPQHDEDEYHEDIDIDDIRNHEADTSREQCPESQPIDWAARQHAELHQNRQQERPQNKRNADSHLFTPSLSAQDCAFHVKLYHTIYKNQLSACSFA